jgi:hypothetical protein
LPANTEITGEFHETHHLARVAARDNSAPSKAYKANSLRAITGNFQEQIREGMAGAGKNGVASEGVGLALKKIKSLQADLLSRVQAHYQHAGSDVAAAHPCGRRGGAGANGSAAVPGSP